MQAHIKAFPFIYVCSLELCILIYIPSFVLPTVKKLFTFLNIKFQTATYLPIPPACLSLQFVYNDLSHCSIHHQVCAICKFGNCPAYTLIQVINISSNDPILNPWGSQQDAPVQQRTFHYYSTAIYLAAFQIHFVNPWFQSYCQAIIRSILYAFWEHILYISHQPYFPL